MNCFHSYSFCFVTCFAISGLATADDLWDAHDRIASMTDAERELLHSREKAFHDLSEEQREEYRRLHVTIESDPSLKQTARRYAEFLDSLPAWQREEIRQKSDPTARLAVIRRINTERRQREKGATAEDAPWDRSPGLPQGMRGLTAEELNQVMTTLQSELTFTEEERERMASLKRPQRHAWILARAIRTGASNSRNSPGQWINQYQRTITEAMPDEIKRRFGRSLNDSRGKFLLTMLVFRPLQEEWKSYLETAVPEEELEKLLASMSIKEQMGYINQPPDDMKRRLAGKYLEENPEVIGVPKDDLEALRELGRFFRGLRSMFSRGGPGPDGPPPGVGTPRDGRPDGRGPDGRGPEGRGPDGRRSDGDRRGFGNFRGPREEDDSPRTRERLFGPPDE
ncbi:hypothetical protein [Calycomorphotria hydatis]|uniref:DUF3106 domain-containing protein n=1 Tax=Calycomorphotria hydatis TaxID=2528027 RepID=A0A517TDY6_9PLAN|nr:hypothetical protein [Calycomorphotria hydatis]QDT66588.1 hypothetical protein V22_38580 [Calycomorphotria hydatis]